MVGSTQHVRDSHDTGSTTSERQRPSLASWIGHWQLALCAGLAWAFTFIGFGLEHFADISGVTPTPFYLVAYLFGGTLAAKVAFEDLLQKTVNVDLLMVLAAIGAATLGAWWEGAMLLALFATSNALEHHALDRTRNAVRALMDLSPQEATVLAADGERITPIEQLVVGDVVLIRPGEKVPADAEVESGSSVVDQAAITGESVPVVKQASDDLFAGTMNGSGALQARITRPSHESTLARIVRMVEEARDQKSRAERFTDAFEGPYAIGVIVIAFLIATVPLAFGVDAGSAFYRAMTLLVVASPCALVISTPAATLSAIAAAARNGILVKGGSYLEQIGGITTVAFDKTGTLTFGTPRLTDVVSFDGEAGESVLARVASAERLSEHPLSRAITTAAEERGLTLSEAQDFQSQVGRGITATVNAVQVTVGNETLFSELGIPMPSAVERDVDRLQRQGKTVMLVGNESRVTALVAVADTLRPDASHVVSALKHLGISRTVMLTGDSMQVARAIADEVGLDDVHAELMPEDKLAVIDELARAGRVVMVGDGVNDAPALAKADVGIAMGGGGTDVALETADVILMGDDLTKLPAIVELSRRTRRTIRVNITFALAVIAVLLGFTLTVGIPLPVGVIGHEGSTIIVVLNGLRLLGRDDGMRSIGARLRGSARTRADARPTPV